MKTFKTKHGDIIIDDEDYERVLKKLQTHTFVVYVVKGKIKNIRLVNKERESISFLGFLMNTKSYLHCKDGNVFNNTKGNIGIGRKTTLKYKGVRLSSIGGDLYGAYLVIDKIVMSIGTYNTDLLAAIAYNKGLDLLGKDASYERNEVNLSKDMYNAIYNNIVVDLVKRTSFQGTNRKNSNCTSIYTGVSFNKANKTNPWLVNICFKSIKLNLGAYSNELTAAQAYNEAVLYLYGQDAKLNPIPRPLHRILDLEKIQEKLIKAEQKKITG